MRRQSRFVMRRQVKLQGGDTQDWQRQSRLQCGDKPRVCSTDLAMCNAATSQMCNAATSQIAMRRQAKGVEHRSGHVQCGDKPNVQCGDKPDRNAATSQIRRTAMCTAATSPGGGAAKWPGAIRRRSEGAEQRHTRQTSGSKHAVK